MAIYMLTNTVVWGLVILIVAHIVKNVKRSSSNYNCIGKIATALLSIIPVSGGAFASVVITRVQEMHLLVSL